MQGGPRIFSQSSTASDLLDRRRAPTAYRTVTFCGRPFQSVRLRLRRRMARGHGLVRFRSPLLTESRLISFPPGTEMFQFPGFAPDGLCIQPPVAPSGCPVEPGCPIRRSPDQSLFGGSPELIAAWRVLHRLCTPRHPPYTLSSLTAFMTRCGQAAPSLHLKEITQAQERTESRPHRDPICSRPAADSFVRLGYLNTPTYELVTDRQSALGHRLFADRPPTGSREPRASTHLCGPRKLEARLSGCRPTGADRDRTGNLRVANAALSRLSYGPV